MYNDQHILAATAPAVVAILPNTGSEVTVQIAVAMALGMLVWGVIYSRTAKFTA
ncbi:MAG TPA: LPXTG cell wall anchor domain-containing protein [Candidatus Saccharimonadales bacterium]|nr:LPXTG cell wall anchor domain-containing protein [Candidatus Saccharimonadales bacterium]